MLARANPSRPSGCSTLAQKDIDERWHFYEQMAGIERTVTADGGGSPMSVSTCGPSTWDWS